MYYRALLLILPQLYTHNILAAMIDITDTSHSASVMFLIESFIGRSCTHMPFIQMKAWMFAFKKWLNLKFVCKQIDNVLMLRMKINHCPYFHINCGCQCLLSYHNFTIVWIGQELQHFTFEFFICISMTGTKSSPFRQPPKSCNFKLSYFMTYKCYPFETCWWHLQLQTVKLKAIFPQFWLLKRLKPLK